MSAPERDGRGGVGERPVVVDPSGHVVRVVPGGELRCPRCGTVEDHPDGKRDKIVIRGAKVYDERGAWSQCLRCSGYYSADLSTWNEADHNPAKGWFVT